MSYQVRRVRSADERAALAADVADLEPRSTILRGEIAMARRGGVHLSVAEDDGRRGGLVAVSRICWDRWEATAVLLDEAAAPSLAATIDRSPARVVYGAGADVAPLMGHLRRARSIIRMPGVVVPAPLPEPAVELYAGHEGARLATVADVPRLARLYEGYELDGIPTMVQLRRRLRRLVRAGWPVIMLEHDGELIGASRLGPITERFALSTDTTLLPAARGERYTWVLMSYAYDLARERGVGFLGTLAPSNPIQMETLGPVVELFGGHVEEWSNIALHAPVRFRGQGRLRKIWWTLGGRRHFRRAERVRPDGT